MGEKGKEIVQDRERIVELLNRALADEWLAIYQYWNSAKLVTGPMADEAKEEFEEHTEDEMRHASMVFDRILQLGGEPLLDPRKWFDLSNCGYEIAANGDVKKLLEQNIDGERCAINVYHELANFTKDRDHVTYAMVVEILRDEVEHEEDLQKIYEYLEKE